MDGLYYGYTDFFKRGCYFSGVAVGVRDQFRLLWEQHVYWTRMVILGIIHETPDLKAATNRLLRNAPDFAELFGRFYGYEIAAEFSRLMTEHLVIAADLVKASKAGNSSAAAEAERKWYANANEISYFLNKINPNWSLAHMRAMWFEHLALLKAEAVATLNKDHARSVQIFDQIEKQAMIMADDFSNGLILQFRL